MTTHTYPNAIIYGIKCGETNELYIGSTVSTLVHRTSVHQTTANRYNKWVANGSVGKRPGGSRCCSTQILNRNYYIVFQIEPYPCNTLSELCLREGELQMQYKSSIGVLCINKRVAGAVARAGSKVEYDKQYSQKNATKRAIRNGVKHDCSVCGGKYRHGDRAQHFKTQKHQGAMQSDSRQ